MNHAVDDVDVVHVHRRQGLIRTQGFLALSSVTDAQNDDRDIEVL